MERKRGTRPSDIQIRKKRREELERNQEFYNCIKDIVYHPVVLKMKDYYQHCDTDCYQHCLCVAYYNYRICKALNLDYRSAARGGMLHDLFLYDWRTHKKRTGDPFHGMTHPRAAYNMAKKYFRLNSVEKEVITKHMWPLTLFPPRNWETYVICLTDKYCSSLEIADYYSGYIEKRIYGKMMARIIRKLKRKFPELQNIISEIASEEKAAREEFSSGYRQRAFSRSWKRKADLRFSE